MWKMFPLMSDAFEETLYQMDLSIHSCLHDKLGTLQKIQRQFERSTRSLFFVRAITEIALKR